MMKKIVLAFFCTIVVLIASCATSGVGDWAEAYFNQGLAYYYKGDYTRARADFNKALQIDPNDELAWNNFNALGNRGR